MSEDQQLVFQYSVPIERSAKGAGERVFVLTEEGEEYFSPKIEGRIMALWEAGA